MVRLILKYLNKIKNLFVIVPVLVVTMLFAGLYFANQKSKPEFDSPVDRIMFETKNKSPKYVMTLPDTKKEVAVSEKEEKKPEQEEPKREKTNNEKLSELDIPLMSRLPKREETKALSHILPDEALRDKDGLPTSSEILKPWESYGRKENVMPMFAKVAVVIKNVGPNPINTNLIIQRLPSDISLSFSPYTKDLPEVVTKARENGHETYLDMLLPSKDFSISDSGPLALDFGQTIEQNLEILDVQLGKPMAVGGFVVSDGLDDTKYNPYILAVMGLLERRGLLMADATHGINFGNNNVKGLDRVRADIVIDNHFDRTFIREQLQEAEQRAYRTGNVVIIADPKPVVVLEIARWVEGFSKQLSYEEMKAQGVNSFEKPLALVPLSNLAGEY